MIKKVNPYYIYQIQTNQAQPLNIDLKIEVCVENINQRYGIQPKEKLGDLIVDTQSREHL